MVHQLNKHLSLSYSELEYYPGTKNKIPGGLVLVRHDTNYFKNKLSGILETEPGKMRGATKIINFPWA